MEVTYKAIKDEVLHRAVPFLTEEEYRQLLSGSMMGIGAFSGEVPVAVLLCGKRDTAILTLEKIYVGKDHRRQGVGTHLMKLLCSFVDSGKYDLLFSFEAEGKDAEVFRFLQAQEGFYIEEEEGFEALLSAEEVAAVHAHFKGKEAEPQLYFAQTKKMQQDFVEELEKEYPAMAWSLKNDQNTFCKELCCSASDRNGIQAVCLMKKHTEELELHFLYAKGGKGVLAAKALMGMVSLMTEDRAVPMRMSLVNETSVKILKQMSKNYTVTKQMYTAYYVGI